MRWLVFLALVGCGDRDVAQLEKVKREVCACKDAACANAAMSTLPKNDVKPTRKEQALARDMLDCLAKIYVEAAPAPSDPDGSGSAQAPSGSGSAAP